MTLNIVVHQYAEVDIGILAEMVNHHLTDFETFRSEILAYVEDG